MWTYFLRNPISYDLRKGNEVLLPPTRLVRYGINSLLFQGSLLWSNLPSSVKDSETLNEFKFRLKIRGKVHCPCNLCH